MFFLSFHTKNAFSPLVVVVVAAAAAAADDVNMPERKYKSMKLVVKTTSSYLYWFATSSFIPPYTGTSSFIPPVLFHHTSVPPVLFHHTSVPSGLFHNTSISFWWQRVLHFSHIISLALSRLTYIKLICIS